MRRYGAKVLRGGGVRDPWSGIIESKGNGRRWRMEATQSIYLENPREG